MIDLEALKARHPILEVARDLGLEVNHNRFRCPHSERHVHGDRTPSVTLWPERGFFKCWVCPEVKGDVIDLVQVVKHAGFSDAVAFLEKHEGFAGSKHHAHPAASQAQGELFQIPSSAKIPERTSSAMEPQNEDQRSELLDAFLGLCSPVHGKIAAWLKTRRIFKKTWDGQRLRVVENYGAISDALLARFPLTDLRESGLFNAEGHLRFYRHPLLLPYFNREGQTIYLQARAVGAEIKPKELSLAGSIPCPYNMRALDGDPGPVYMCEGVIDALTLIEAGFPTVGIPGAANFKPAWVPLFQNKSVYVVFDPDAAGEAGSGRAVALLTGQGIEAHRLNLPAGKDINDWLRSGGLGALI